MHPTQKHLLWKVMHEKSGGQVPLQAGAAALPQAWGWFLQAHGPPAAVPGVHTSPGGQNPPHCGDGLVAQGTGMSWQPQLGVPVICEQT